MKKSGVIKSSFYMPEEEFTREQIEYIRDNSVLMPEIDDEMKGKIDSAVDLLFVTRQEWEKKQI
jgi:hypothetical protein